MAAPLFAELAALEQAGQPFVLVTVLAAEGSTPRAAGTKMAVTADRAIGTIGGGQLEFHAIEAARALLEGTASQPVTRKLPLGPALGQCCGGSVTLLLEPIRPPALRLALFGAGHVGRALVRVLGDLPTRIDWIDPRATEFPANRPSPVQVQVTERVEQAVAALPAGTGVLVMTHSHPLDLAIVAAALARDDLPYIGLIGSATKRARFLRRLTAIGLGPAAAQRLICPIGVAGIRDKRPEAIAIAVAAQVLQLADGAPVATFAVGAAGVIEEAEHDGI